MAERRIPFSAKDDDGVAHRGEIIIAPSWRPDLAPYPHAAFTIVLAEQPLTSDSPALPSGALVVCAPATRIRLPASVAEPTAVYEAGGHDAPTPLRLSGAAARAFAAGTLLAGRPIAVRASEVFGATQRPDLHLLARELIAAGQRVEAYWRTIDEVLSWPSGAARMVRPEKVRERLERALDGVGRAPRDATVSDALERLRAIARGGAPTEVASSTPELREDVALLRCLAERREEALALAAMRSYLDGATPRPAGGSLVVDHAATREQLSFATLLTEPRQLDRMRATFEVYRQAFATAYLEHHRRYWRAAERLRALLDDAASVVAALARLNTIEALGRPLGGEAVLAYARLAGGPGTCVEPDLERALREHPACPTCGVTLPDGPPVEQTEQTLRRVHRALGRQQQRLASEAVRRILARGGERIEQFLQVVQASDLSGLASVLDDDLVGFLRELLSEPVAPTREALDLFEQLARAYPTVSEEQLDAVVETLRQLLSERLASRQAEDPARPAAFQLAALPRDGS